MLQFISLVIVAVLTGGSEPTNTAAMACDTTSDESTSQLVSTEDATVGLQSDLTCEEQCILDFVGAARGACLRLCKQF